jgi:mannosyltransferase
VPAAPLLALLALGAALRAAGLASHELWTDEYGTAWVVAGSFAQTFERALAVQGQSPLYYLGVRLSTVILGPGVLALRLPSLLCGVALLALAYPLALRVFGDRRAALGSVFACAVHGRLIYYSQEARPYALALLLAAASFTLYASLRQGRAPGRTRTAAWLAATVAAFYAHYLFGLVALVQALHLLLARPRPRPGPWLLGFGLVALLALPALAQLADLFARRETIDWVPPQAGRFPVLRLAASGLDLEVLAPAAAAAVLAAWRGRRVRLPEQARPSLVLLWFAVPFAALDLASRAFGVTLLDERYAVVAAPAAALLQGLVLAWPRGRPLLAALPLALFVWGVLALRLLPAFEASGVFSERYVGQEWTRATRELVAGHRPGEPIFYRTQFVELDAVRRGRASEAVSAFSAWPVAAHLPADRTFVLRPLPVRPERASRAELEAVLREAAAAPGAWIIGMPPVLPELVRLARRDLRLRVVRHDRFGDVHLIELRPALAGPAGGEP